MRRSLRILMLAFLLVPMVLAAYWLRDTAWPFGIQQLATGCVVVAETFYYVLRQVVGWSPVGMGWVGMPHVALDFWLTVYLMGILVALPSELLGNWLARLADNK